MSRGTNISWCTGSWNPGYGCTKVSPGCHHCYAILQCWMKQHHPNPTISNRFAGLVEKRPDGSLNWTGKVVEAPERLSLPIKTKTPTEWFVMSLSDPFHDGYSDDYIAQMFAVAALCPHHKFQFLTKRPERAVEWFTTLRPLETTEELVAWWAPHLPKECGDVIWDSRGSDPDNYWGVPSLALGDPKVRAEIKRTRRAWPGWPLPNVWIGASVEDQKAADERIPLLLQIPAAVRFLSCEPLLGPIELWHWVSDSPEMGEYNLAHYGRSTPIDWVIAGGESGKDARRMDLEWARSLRDQCEAAGIAYHFKQTGVVTAKELGMTGHGSHLEEIPEDLRIRELPSMSVAC